MGKKSENDIRGRYEPLYQSSEVSSYFFGLGAFFLFLTRDIEVTDTRFMLWSSATVLTIATRLIICRIANWRKQFNHISKRYIGATILAWSLLGGAGCFPPNSGEEASEFFYLMMVLMAVSSSLICYQSRSLVVFGNLLFFGLLTTNYFLDRNSSPALQEVQLRHLIPLPIIMVFNLLISGRLRSITNRQYLELVELDASNRQAQLLAEEMEGESELKGYAVEATKAVSQAKSVFLANISHEIRTPLNAVIGFSQLLVEDEKMPSQFQENLQRISVNAQHLLVLINDVLDMSKIESGRLSLEPEQVDLTQLLRTTAEFVIRRAEDKGLGLRLEIGSKVPNHTRLDPLKFRQVLINLLNNAVKFTDVGSVTIYVKSSSRPGFFEFGVSDSGKGIAEEDQNRLFKEFEQCTNSKGLEGTGLGLAISKNIVDLMGGRLTVKSTVGQGSRFFFTIPLETLREPEKVLLPKPIVNDSRGNLEILKHTTVLIVDDIQSNRLLLRSCLKPLGVNLIEAVDGVEAIAMWQTHQPDIILMDRRMPKIGGVKATSVIRDEAQSLAIDAPIIFAVSADVIGRNTVNDWPGIDGFIPKPFDVREVKNVIRSAIINKSNLEDTGLILPS